MAEEETPGLEQPPGLKEFLERYNRVLTDFGNEVEHDYNLRHNLITTERRLRASQEKEWSNVGSLSVRMNASVVSCATS